MPQLRCALTSEVIAEGDPWHLCLIADQLGRDEVLFDGVNTYQHGELVGEAFNPDAVLASHADELARLEAQREDAESDGARENIESALQGRRAAIAGALAAVPSAEAAMASARDRAEL